jgi:hypothetical protein
MTRHLPIVALCLLVSGCASPLTQSSRSENASQHQASTGSSQAAVDIVDKTVTQPKPTPAPPSVGTLTVSGENNKVEVVSPPPAPPTATAPDTRDTRVGVNSESKGSTSDSWWASLDSSTSLTIIGFAVGIILLVGFAVWLVGYLRSKSVAVRILTDKVDQKAAEAAQAWGEYDRSLADKIQRLRTAAATTSDPIEMARLSAQIAELERERGIANAE